LAKLLPTILFLLSTVAAGFSDFNFSPSTAQVIAQEAESYHHLTVAKKSDAASQMRYFYMSTAVFAQIPDVLIISLPLWATLSLDYFFLNLLTSDIPPPVNLG
jgi:hypothetical protein